jgi:hypothetical protein
MVASWFLSEMGPAAIFYAKMSSYKKITQKASCGFQSEPSENIRKSTHKDIYSLQKVTTNKFFRPHNLKLKNVKQNKSLNQKNVKSLLYLLQRSLC